MKILTLQEDLVSALQAVYKAVPSNPQLPILSSFLFTISAKEMQVAATDLYVGITSTVTVNAEEELQVAIPAKTFYDLITSLEKGKLELEIIENSVIVKSQSTKTKLPVQAADDFPAFPQIEGESLALSQEQVEAMVNNVGFCASSDQARLVLTALHLQTTDQGLEAVATDGFRLSRYLLPFEGAAVTPLLFSAKALSEILRIAKQLNQDQITILYSEADKQAVVSIAQTQVFVRLIDGDYPPYEKILPSGYEIQVLVDAKEFVTQVKRALVVAREVSNVITLSIAGDQMKIEAQSSVTGTHTGEMPVQITQGGEISIAFNATYLLDFINHVKPETLVLEMTEPLKPVVIKDERQENLSYLVMPFRTNQ